MIDGQSVNGLHALNRVDVHGLPDALPKAFFSGPDLLRRVGVAPLRPGVHVNMTPTKLFGIFDETALLAVFC